MTTDVAKRPKFWPWQSITNQFRVSQSKLGKKVLPLSRYVKPQGILSADRIILNSKKDEILLVANTDVKIVTKGWNSDMEEFFDTILDFMEEVIKQNKELERQKMRFRLCL